MYTFGCVLLTLLFSITRCSRSRQSAKFAHLANDSIKSPVVACAFLTHSANNSTDKGETAPSGILWHRASLAGRSGSAAVDVSDNGGSGFVSAWGRGKQGFDWGRALFKSFVFLSIEQAYVVHDNYGWVICENGIPFNHYWRDYKQSLSTWTHSGWDDGDSFVTNYIGHPVQGALTG